jgi:hypothetical protein
MKRITFTFTFTFIFISLFICILLLQLTLPVIHALRTTALTREEQHSIQHHWKQLDRITPEEEIVLNVAIKQPVDGVAALEERLREISNPVHESYGQWLSIGQIGEYIKPPSSTVDALISFFHKHNVINYTLTMNHDFMQVWMKARDAEQAFGVARFHRFKSMKTGKVIHRTYEHVNVNDDNANKRSHKTTLSASRRINSTIVPYYDQGLPSAPIPRILPLPAVNTSNITMSGAYKPAASNFSAISQYVDYILGLNDFVFNAAGAMYQPPSLVNDSAPYIRFPKGDESHVYTLIQLYCQDGNATQFGSTNSTLKLPCEDHPPTIDYVTLDVIPYSAARGIRKIYINFTSHATGRYLYDTYTIYPQSFAVYPFDKVQFRAASHYSDGTSSKAGTLPYPYQPTVYSDPAYIRHAYSVPPGLHVTNSNTSNVIFQSQSFGACNANLTLQHVHQL